MATVRYGGRDGTFDHGEFQVWTVSVDEQLNVVRMSPRRLKTPEPLIPVSRDPQAFADLRAEDLRALVGSFKKESQAKEMAQRLRRDGLETLIRADGS